MKEYLDQEKWTIVSGDDIVKVCVGYEDGAPIEVFMSRWVYDSSVSNEFTVLLGKDDTLAIFNPKTNVAVWNDGSVVSKPINTEVRKTVRKWV